MPTILRLTQSYRYMQGFFYFIDFLPAWTERVVSVHGRRNQSAKPETLFVFIEKDRSAYTAAN